VDGNKSAALGTPLILPRLPSSSTTAGADSKDENMASLDTHDVHTSIHVQTEAAHLRLPTEIWHLILEAFIDISDVLNLYSAHNLLQDDNDNPNSTSNREGNYDDNFNDDHHHHTLLGVHHICPNKESSQAFFAIAEERRRIIKLVCRSWKRFADENTHRAIRLKASHFLWETPQQSDNNPRQRNDGIVQLHIHENESGNADHLRMARRAVAFWTDFRINLVVEDPEDTSTLQTLASILSEPTNLVILSINVAGPRTSNALDILIDHRACLFHLQFLSMKIMGSDLTGFFGSISNSFGDRLTHLKLSYKRNLQIELDTSLNHVPNNPNNVDSSWTWSSRFLDNSLDKLILPHLQFLEYTFPSLNRKWTTLSEWSLPALLHFSIGFITTTEDVNELIDALESFGSNLRSLVIRRSEDLKFIRMPADFWELVPNLEAFTTSLDGLSFMAPPETSSLKKIIHEGSQGLGLDRFMVAIRPMLSSPWPHIHTIVLCKVWWHLLLSNKYMERHTFGPETRLFELAEWCERKSIRMLDGLGLTLRHARENRLKILSSFTRRVLDP
jgi:hypothetical protein